MNATISKDRYHELALNLVRNHSAYLRLRMCRALSGLPQKASGKMKRQTASANLPT